MAACTSGTSSSAHRADVAAQRTEGTTLRVWGATKLDISPASIGDTAVDTGGKNRVRRMRRRRSVNTHCPRHAPRSTVQCTSPQTSSLEPPSTHPSHHPSHTPLTLVQQLQQVVSRQVGQEAQGKHLTLWHTTADVILVLCCLGRWCEDQREGGQQGWQR